MKQTAHSVNSSKNLLLVNNNPNRENTDISNESYSHDTNEDKHINDDIQNQSYNYNSLIITSIFLLVQIIQIIYLLIIII